MWPQGSYTDTEKGIANSVPQRFTIYPSTSKGEYLLVSKVRVNGLTNSVIVLTTSALLIPASETYR